MAGPTNFNSRLDEILIKYAVFAAESTSIPEFVYQSDRHLTWREAKAAIKELFLEMIGEDIKDNGACVVRNDDGSVHSSSAGSYKASIQNELRQQLRNTVEGKK